MIEILPPRDFSDFTVPRRPDGSLLQRCQSEEDCQVYLHWISDYLHKTDLPLTPDQVDWLTECQRSPGVAVRDCATIFAHSILEIGVLNYGFAQGRTYAQYRARSLEIFQEEFTDNDREVLGPFEEWVLSEAVFERFRRERQQELDSGQDWVFADIPFRPILAWALHQIPDPAERYQLMDEFFRVIDENSGQ